MPGEFCQVIGRSWCVLIGCCQNIQTRTLQSGIRNTLHGYTNVVIGVSQFTKGGENDIGFASISKHLSAYSGELGTLWQIAGSGGCKLDEDIPLNCPKRGVAGILSIQIGLSQLFLSAHV
jgi:hypothetical protein